MTGPPLTKAGRAAGGSGLLADEKYLDDLGIDRLDGMVDDARAADVVVAATGGRCVAPPVRRGRWSCRSPWTPPASRPRQRSMLNGDIIRLFKDLRVSDSFLMKTNVREMLFRKPAK